jgi:hypothetical protein
MNGTITKEEILDLDAIDKQIDALYKLRDEKRKAISSRTGEGTVCYLHEDVENESKYLRITITDNIRKLQAGETLFRAASINPVDIKIERLKREPKDTVILG